MPETPMFPEPQRTLITTRKEYLDAVQQMLAAANRQLRVFDPDLSELDFNSRSTVAELRRILSGGRAHQVRIALHNVEYVSKHSPRLIELMSMFPSGIHIFRTEGEAARVQDRFVIADETHLVRRPVAAQGRGTVLRDDPQEGNSMVLRFEEIWASSVSAVSPTQAGL